MRGYLISIGFKISEKRLSSAMYRVDPVNYEHAQKAEYNRSHKSSPISSFVFWSQITH